MATATEGATEAAGMPQLEFSTFPNQIFWLVVTLVVLYYIISRIAIPRIGGTLEDRHEVISNDLEQAADLKRRAEEAEAAYEKALAEARSEAQKIAADTRAQINKELEAASAKADAEIAAQTAESEARIAEIRESAMANVEQVATETAQSIVETLMPGAADRAAVAQAVDARLKG